jgi:hypothetical protein
MTAERWWRFSSKCLMADEMMHGADDNLHPVIARRPKADAAIHSTHLAA